MLIDNEPIYDSGIVATRYYTTANTNPALSNLSAYCLRLPPNISHLEVFRPLRIRVQKSIKHQIEPYRIMLLPIGGDLC